MQKVYRTMHRNRLEEETSSVEARIFREEEAVHDTPSRCGISFVMTSFCHLARESLDSVSCFAFRRTERRMDGVWTCGVGCKE